MDDIVKAAKLLVSEGRVDGRTKRDFHLELEKRATAYRKDHPALTPEQSYARYAMETDEGRALFKAYSRAPADPPPAPPFDANLNKRAADEGRRLMADGAYAREILAKEHSRPGWIPS